MLRKNLARCCLLLPILSWAEEGILDLKYTAEYWQNTRGGIRTGHAYLDNIDISYKRAIGEKNSLHVPDGTFFVHLLFNNSSQLSNKLVGDRQVVSNIDNRYNHRLYEAWFESEVGENQSVKVGLIDLNSEFDVIETAGLFLNSSHGIGPDFSQTGENGPSIFPTPALGIRYLNSLNRNWSVRVAAFDAVAGDPDRPRRNDVRINKNEGALLSAEINYQLDDMRYGFGLWQYSSRSPHLHDAESSHNRGTYAFVESGGGAAEPRELAWWLRIGFTNHEINVLDQYIGAGISFMPMPHRSQERMGLAIAHGSSRNLARCCAPFVGSRSRRASETILELSYRINLNDSIVLQPDAQYVFNPGLQKAYGNALVYGLRVEWTPLSTR